MLGKKFYINYGKVLYALAMADGEIQPEEKNELIKLVRRVLQPMENLTDEFGTDLSYYTEFAFEAQEEYKNNPRNMLDGFFAYLKKDNVWLTEQQKKVIIWIMQKVADAYGGTSEEEQLLINEFKRKIEAF